MSTCFTCFSRGVWVAAAVKRDGVRVESATGGEYLLCFGKGALLATSLAPLELKPFFFLFFFFLSSLLLFLSLVTEAAQCSHWAHHLSAFLSSSSKTNPPLFISTAYLVYKCTKKKKKKSVFCLFGWRKVLLDGLERLSQLQPLHFSFFPPHIILVSYYLTV